MMKMRKLLLSMNALTRMQEVEVELRKKQEKTIERNLPLLKEMLAGVKVEKHSLRWFRGYIDNEVVAPERGIRSVFKLGTKSAQYNVTRVAASVESTFPSTGSIW